VTSPNAFTHARLLRFAWLSVGTALATIALKTGAYLLTESVGLLSDAAESIVNLVAALVALLALKQAAKPADSRYPYGRSKAEYFSSAVEGAMVFAAAAFIIVAAIQRLLAPQPLERVGIGMAVSMAAAIVNAVVGITLLRAGKRYLSPTLRADGTHLLTDVVTSAGVLLGVALVAATGWDALDPIVALLVGLNIIITGTRMVRASLSGLMDVTLPEEQNRAIIGILQAHTNSEIRFHGLQTRAAGHDAFANVDLLVPGLWSVRRGHELAEDLADELEAAVPNLHVLIHVEPIEDPRSYDDIPDGYVPLGDVGAYKPRDALAEGEGRIQPD